MPVQNRLTKVKRVKKSGDRSDPRQVAEGGEGERLAEPDRPLVDPGVFPQLILQPILVRGVRPSSSDEVAEEVAEVVEDVAEVAEEVAEVVEVAEDVAEDVAEESRTVRTGVEDKRDTPVGPI